MIQDYSKAPRLYTNDSLKDGQESLSLSRDHAHYLMHVMRKNDGDIVRLFNGRDGEYVGKIAIISKKDVTVKWLEKVKDQPSLAPTIHLYFAPIKKDRMAWLIEKSVELGVTDLHPIITERTQHANKINPDKIEKQIIEAAEQCERLDIPQFHPITYLHQCDFSSPVFCAMERTDAPIFTAKKQKELAILVGPEGGWSDNERDYLSAHAHMTPVSLGNNILRAETAALLMLARIY